MNAASDLKMDYRLKEYWTGRLSGMFNLRGAGHISFSENYNRQLYNAKIRGLKKALSFHNINIDGKAVCDVGCGSGFFLDFYKYHGAKNIAGIDIAGISVKNLQKEYPGHSFIEGDISSVQIMSHISSKFDILNIFDVLYHIKDSRAFERAIYNISFMTKKGGFIFITDLLRCDDIECAAHVTFRAKTTYEAIFEKTNIEIIGIFPLYFLLNRPIFSRAIKKIGPALDSLFARAYYYLDAVLLSQKRNNMNLMVARKLVL